MESFYGRVQLRSGEGFKEVSGLFHVTVDLSPFDVMCS